MGGCCAKSSVAAIPRLTCLSLAQISGATYKPQSEVVKDVQNLALKDLDNNMIQPRAWIYKETFSAVDSDIFGIVIAQPGVVVIAFRGTVPQLTANVEEDMDFVSESVFANHVLATDPRFATAKCGRGWGQAYTSIRQKVVNLVTEAANLPNHGHDKPDLYVTGHSLGGAMAVLAGVDLCAITHHVNDGSGGDLFRSVSVVTFGCPRVGDKQFAQASERVLGENVHLIQNYHDLAPHIYPQVFGYRHINHLWEIGPFVHEARRITEVYNPYHPATGDPAQYHHIGTYTQLLASLGPDLGLGVCLAEPPRPEWCGGDMLLTGSEAQTGSPQAVGLDTPSSLGGNRNLSESLLAGMG